MRIGASAEHKSREAKQRRLVRDRDVLRGEKPCCLMEVLHKGEWIQCGRAGANQTIHIVIRRECGEFWDDPIVAILGCLECHRIYDRNTLGEPKYRVRAPFEPAAQAWVFLLNKVDAGELKTKPIARYNPFANSDYQDVWDSVA